MLKSDYFKQHIFCLDNGIAQPINKEKRFQMCMYECTKFGGECRMMKCVSAHNHFDK